MIPGTATLGLHAQGIEVHFDGVKAVDGVDCRLARGEILALIGPNGAGKTTMVNALSGFQRVGSGTVAIDGTDVTALPAHRRARVGLVRTFQSQRLFADLTVEENVEAACVANGMTRRAAIRRVDVILDRMGLSDKRRLRANELAQGDEQYVSIARALATEPKYLLLDEPAAGLNEAESDQLVRQVRAIRDDYGCGVLVIEHDMRFVMALCERIQVLDHGSTLAEGSPREIREDPAVIRAYLGSQKGGHDA